MGYVCMCRCEGYGFQAEDGIRDAQESRGLGDVYKRQAVFYFVHQVEKDSLKHHKMTQNSLSSSYPVSYTHLTLPTNREV